MGPTVVPLVFAALAFQPAAATPHQPRLALDVGAGWAAPHGWERPFGGGGPVLDMAVAHDLTTRVAVRIAGSLEVHRQTGVAEPLFFCDPGPCDPDNLPPDGFRGVTLWHAAVGPLFNVLPPRGEWRVTSFIGGGFTRVVPTGQVAYTSFAETRPLIASGVQVARRVEGRVELFLGVQGRGIIGLDLTSVPPTPGSPPPPQSTPVTTGWSFPVTAGATIRMW